MKTKRRPTTPTLDDDDAPFLTAAEFDHLRSEGRVRVVLNNNNRLKVLRARLQMSQAEFARAYGFSLRTVQEWEQGRHKPDRIARNLLKLIAAHPDMTRKVLSKAEAA